MMARLGLLHAILCIALLLLLFQPSQVLCHNKTSPTPPCPCQCPDNTAQTPSSHPPPSPTPPSPPSPSPNSQHHHHKHGSPTPPSPPSPSPNSQHHHHKHGSSTPSSHPPPSPNSQHHHHKHGNPHDQGEMVHAFTKWVNFIGGLDHSNFPVASNHFNPIDTIVVHKDASRGNYASIQEAINSVPIVNQRRVVIKINAGVYTEQLVISPLRSFITLEGAGADKTIIQWGGSGANPGLGAYGSATLAINAPNFIAKGITFKNTAPEAAAGVGVAVRVSADTAAFTGCNFLGLHNTLYDHVGRHYYKDCSIEGGMDFIFGQALSFFEGCYLKAAAEAKGDVSPHRAASLLDNSGLSFYNCKLSGAALFYLGKAWGTFARVVLTNSYLDHVEIPKALGNSADANSQTHVLLGLHKCSGSGATFAEKASWAKELTDEQVSPFKSLKFIDGLEWINH